MSLGTSFRHVSPANTTTATGAPSYDFVARPQAAPVGSFVAPTVADAVALAPVVVPEKPPGLSSTQKGLLALVLAVLLALVLSVVATFLLPVYRAHQRAAQVAATSVVLPHAVDGLTKVSGADQPRVTALLAEYATPTPPMGAVYSGSKHRRAVVAAAAFAMTDQDQNDFLTAATTSAHSHGIQLVEVAAGARGGHLRCGSSGKTQTLCVFTDVGAYGVLVVPGTGPGGLVEATTFRSSVELRK